MSSANQKTLFQTWGSVGPKITSASKEPGKKLPQRRRAATSSQVKAKKKCSDNAGPSLWAEIGQGSAGRQDQASRQEQEREQELDEVDDDLILVAVHEAEKSLGNQPTATSVEDPGEVCSDLPGFDSSSGRMWIYPTNFPVRDYQMNISEAALFQNTLVCLPTGLGKTFIGSVVMYNFYRWYPAGKIVFLAPTKPLVAQQIEACYRVMGIPQQHMAELTGSSTALVCAVIMSMTNSPSRESYPLISFREHSGSAETRAVAIQARFLPHAASHGERSVSKHVSCTSDQVRGYR